MIEKDYHAQIREMAKKYGCTFYKISDLDASQLFYVTGEQVHTRKKPFDFIVTNGGKLYFVEAKLEKNAVNTFNLKKVEEHQYEWLYKFKKKVPSEFFCCEIWLCWKPRKEKNRWKWSEYHFPIMELIQQIKENGYSLKMDSEFAMKHKTRVHK